MPLKIPKSTTMFQQYIAFTLAEVLITMTIIGIIAALTIPTLVKNYEITQNKAIFKKAYAILAYDIQMLNQDYNGVGSLFFATSPNHYNELYNVTPHIIYLSNAMQYQSLVLLKYLPIYKYCTYGARGATAPGLDPGQVERYPTMLKNTCWGFDPAYDDRYITYLKGGNTAPFSGDEDAFILNNGIGIRVSAANDIYIDVNNTKGPNVLGKDIFVLHMSLIDSNGTGVLAPYNADPTTTCIEDSTAAGNTGYGCAKKYIMQ